VPARKDIPFNSLTAGFFLALFLFIHGAIASHQHDSVKSVCKRMVAATEVSQESDCSICDYHFSKDGYHFNNFPQVQKIQEALYAYSFYNTPFITSIGSTSSGRGPPAFS
jgi:hypothetical protein